MSKEGKIYLFKDRDDYIKNLSNDDVINIIGTKGSGKTTSTLKFLNDDEYIVINCDRLFEQPENIIREDKYLPEIRNVLKNKYGQISGGKEFIKYYKDILDYTKKIGKKIIIEGNAVYDIEPITQLRGKVIVKRTGIIKCFIRTIKRDYPNEYFLKKEIEKHGKFGKIYRLINIVTRRKNIFKLYHDIERIINTLEKY